MPASHYLAYQRAFTELERLYLLERVDKHGALAPLTVREALGVVAVRADDATVCPIDYLDLADPDLQPLRRCAAASWVKSRTSTRRPKRSYRALTNERLDMRPQMPVFDALSGICKSGSRPSNERSRGNVKQPEQHEYRDCEPD